MSCGLGITDKGCDRIPWVRPDELAQDLPADVASRAGPMVLGKLLQPRSPVRFSWGWHTEILCSFLRIGKECNCLGRWVSISLLPPTEITPACDDDGKLGRGKLPFAIRCQGIK